MATVKHKIVTCDVCGNTNDVQAWAFGFDGKRYEIDLCPKDSKDLNEVVDGYASKARKVTAGRGQRRNGRRPEASRPGQQAVKASGARAKSAGSKKEARTSRSQPQKAKTAPKQAAATSGSQPQDVMAPAEQPAATSGSQPQDVMAPAEQPAATSGSQPQDVMAPAEQPAATSRSQPQNAKAAPKPAAKAGRSQPQNAKAAPEPAAKAGRSQPQKAKAAPKQAPKTSDIRQEKGIYVYGVLPADIEVADEIQGVGEDPGPLGIIRSDGLAALISEVGLPGRLGSPEDLRTYREILDSTAIEVPVVPLRFGTVFSREGSVTDELLAPRRDEFATALEQLEGRVQFLVRGRFVGEALTARRDEYTRAVEQAMEGISVDSVVREPAQERDAVLVAFLVDVDQEPEVERAIDDLAREWAGRIEVRLLGPMAAYDFVMTESD